MTWINATWLNLSSTDAIRRRMRHSRREIALAVVITFAAIVAIFAAVGGVMPDKAGDHPIASITEHD